jgi:hypothetical protein
MKEEPIMIEAMNELTLASVKGFKSKHDDFIDTISMLASLVVWRPSEETSFTNDNENDLWDMNDQEEEEDYLASYLA